MDDGSAPTENFEEAQREDRSSRVTPYRWRKFLLLPGVDLRCQEQTESQHPGFSLSLLLQPNLPYHGTESARGAFEGFRFFARHDRTDEYSLGSGPAQRINIGGHDAFLRGHNERHRDAVGKLAIAREIEGRERL